MVLQDGADDVALVVLKRTVERRVGNPVEGAIGRSEDSHVLLEREIGIDVAVGGEELVELGQVVVTF